MTAGSDHLVETGRAGGLRDHAERPTATKVEPVDVGIAEVWGKLPAAAAGGLIGARRSLSAAQVLGVQRSAGNAAVGRLLGSARSAPPRSRAGEPPGGRPQPPATAEPVGEGSMRGLSAESGTAPEVVVQRDPPTPTNISPPADPAAPPTGPAPEKSVWSTVKALADGSKKFKFGVGSHNLYRAFQGKDFAWSTQKPGPSVQAPLALGWIPLPLPVGPVEVKMQAGVSAYANGHAAVDVTLADVTLEATAADLLLLGQAAASLFIPGLQVVALGMLAALNLKGTAMLRATATAGIEAGARATLEAVLNPALWPVAGYVDGFVGALGSLRAAALFEKPAQVELSLGRLRLIGGQSFPSSSVTLTPEVALNAGVAAGMILGYRPAAVKRELWSHSVAAGVRKQLKAGIEGGEFATLIAGDDGTPVIDLERIIVTGQALAAALFTDRETAADRVDPNPPGTDPRVSAQGIGATQLHGAKPPSNRLGPKILWTTSEHVIPFATGKRLWEVIGLVVPGRGGHEDRDQTTIMIYYEAAETKTRVDNRISEAFEAKVAQSNAVQRMEGARLHIDAGHPQAAKAEVRAVLGLMTAGLRSARDDAVERTDAAILSESTMRMDGSPLTNAERRGPEGEPESVVPAPARVGATANEQYTNILDLAREEVEAANALR